VCGTKERLRRGRERKADQVGAEEVKQIAVSIAVPVLYCSWLALRPWFPRAATIVLLITNLATALSVATYDFIPVRYVLEDWRLQAIVAFELVAAALAIAAFFRYRAALLLSYLVFAFHLSVILWVDTHPFHFERMNVLDYG
jgi:membrane-associated HD superfamily phosphohydrolase